MSESAHFLAADLGASSGRVMLGKWDGERFTIQELHRFPNASVRVGDGLYTDILGIWSNILQGLQKYRALSEQLPQGIGVDAWGVDFGLLDRAGRLIGNPRHYRDPRTDGIPQQVFEKVSEERWFAETGVRTLTINTLFQLHCMVQSCDPALTNAETLLLIPDLCSYLLCGETIGEWSAVTTTQMYSLRRKDWARELLQELSVPVGMLPRIVRSGTLLAPIRPALMKDCGFSGSFPTIAVGSHDTASAVAAIPDLDENSVFLASGTWSLMGVEAEEPNLSEKAMRLGFTNEGSVTGGVLLLRNISGLWILQECLRQWNGEGRPYTWADLVLAAQNASMFASFIDPDAAEFQAPGDMPHAIRLFCGKTGQKAPESIGEVARCAFESLVLRYREVLESLRELTGRELIRIHVVGGGAMNEFLCQMTADASACHVVSGLVEASAMGNFVLQAVATGHLSNVSSGRAALARSEQRTTFYPKGSDAWDEAYARFRKVTASVGGAEDSAAC